MAARYKGRPTALSRLAVAAATDDDLLEPFIRRYDEASYDRAAVATTLFTGAARVCARLAPPVRPQPAGAGAPGALAGRASGPKSSKHCRKRENPERRPLGVL